MSRTCGTGRGAADWPRSWSTRRTASAGVGWLRARSMDSVSIGCAAEGGERRDHLRHVRVGPLRRRRGPGRSAHASRFPPRDGPEPGQIAQLLAAAQRERAGHEEDV
jgi:hypothetical protein